MNDSNHDLLRQRASNNLKKWGRQELTILCVAATEEIGEMAQAIMQSIYEGGDPKRIFDEAIDLGALCLQVMEHHNGDHIA